jgi:hypothetical protein
MIGIIFSLIFASEVFSLERKKIVVIDTGVSISQKSKDYMCDHGVLSAVDDKGLAQHPHGSNITGLIGDQINSKEYCIVSIKFHSGFGGEGAMEGLNKSLDMVLEQKNVIWVNMSLAGDGFNIKEYVLLNKINSQNIGMSVAAGNDGVNLNKECNTYPACYKTMVKNTSLFRVIGSSTSIGNFKSNYGNIVEDKEDGVQKGIPSLTGTSQATAIYTGKLFKD